MTLAAGGLGVDILSPPPRPPGPPPEDPNPRAVVAVVRVGRFELLLSADAESESLRPLDLPDVDAMKVPHHGSSDPGLPELLERLRPELAAIEVGPNTYGHPAPPTLAALRGAGVRTFRTDRHGTVVADHRGRRLGRRHRALVSGGSPKPGANPPGRHLIDSAYRGRPQARLPRLRRRRRQDRRLAGSPAPPCGAGPRPRRTRDFRRGLQRPGRGGGRPLGAQLRPVDPLPAGRRRGRLEGGAARAARGGARRSASRHRAGARGSGQGVQAAGQGGRARQAERCASTRRRSRGSFRSGVSSELASWDCSSTGRRPRAWLRSWAPASSA